GLYAGTSLAFCGATFPIDGASLFARTWPYLLPFTSYVKLDAAERYLAAPATVTFTHLGALVLFILIPGAIGYHAYRRAVLDPSTWGQRCPARPCRIIALLLWRPLPAPFALFLPI